MLVCTSPYLVSFHVQGRALIWPSVQNDDVDKTDLRMYHEAKDVIKGTKYAANHWSEYVAVENTIFFICVVDVISWPTTNAVDSLNTNVQFTSMISEMQITGVAMAVSAERIQSTLACTLCISK